MTTNGTPLYNLKAVVRETGLKPDTLRAWERRYGIPEPDRTAGGHRLYSQQDINTLKWLLERQEEGLSISRAVRLWHRLISDGKDPLQAIPLTRASEQTVTYNAVEVGNTAIELRKSWIDACLAFDERRAEMIMSQAFSYYPPELVCMEVLRKALVEIGDRWYSGEVTTQQEHFASALALRRIDTLITAAPTPNRPGRIVVGCPPGENHTFGALFLTYLLRRRGWDVIYLGANVSLNRLQEMITSTKPDLVIYSSQILESAASLLDVAEFMLAHKIPFAYGGYIFNAVPEVRAHIPGHFLGADLEQVADYVEHLIVNKPPTPSYEVASNVYRHAYTTLVERNGLIESQTWSILEQEDFPRDKIPQANQYLSRDLLAALKLGNLEFVGANLRWLEGLMVNHDMPVETLPIYLRAYYMAAKSVLGDPENPILSWLEGLLETANSGFIENLEFPRNPQ